MLFVDAERGSQDNEVHISSVSTVPLGIFTLCHKQSETELLALYRRCGRTVYYYDVYRASFTYGTVGTWRCSDCRTVWQLDGYVFTLFQIWDTVCYNSEALIQN